VSEFHSLDITFQDEGVLIDVLKELGYKPEVHEEARKLHGYQGDERNQKAHIIIPRKQVGGSSNDIGFERQKDKKFKLHISEYDRNHKNLNANNVKKTYAEKMIDKYTRTNSKFSVRSKQRTKNGSIKIKLRVNR
jgi:hypothetical protein